MPVTADLVSAIALGLPEVEEGLWWRKPAFLVAGKGFARLHEDGVSLVLRMTLVDRQLRLATESHVLFVTEHYRNHPAVLARLAALTPALTQELLEGAWAMVAPKRLNRGEP